MFPASHAYLLITENQCHMKFSSAKRLQHSTFFGKSNAAGLVIYSLLQSSLRSVFTSDSRAKGLKVHVGGMP